MMAPTCGDIVAETESWLRTPYQHQASLKGVGCDCLGLVRGVYRALYGIEPEPVPAYTPDWAEASGEETMAMAASRHLVPKELGCLEPGRVLLFRWRPSLPAKHAAILVSKNRFIHAYDGAAVSNASLSHWWLKRLAFVFAFPPKH
ncbi:MAG: NlpC/P60 family protein [Hyphomicrobiales bacterium]